MQFYGFFLNKNAKKHFVRKFEVINGEIIQQMANGEIRRKPYSKKGESKLLKRMKEQVKDAYGMQGPNIFSLIGLGILHLLTKSESILVSIVANIMSLIFSLEIISNYIKVKDLEKHQYFLWNSESLNSDRVTKNNNVLIGVSQKTQEVIKTTPSDKPAFTINSIDSMSLADLKKIKENIEKEQRRELELLLAKADEIIKKYGGLKF